MGYVPDYGQLSEQPFFEGIRPEEIEPLLTCIQSTFRKYKKGEKITLRKKNIYNYAIVLSGQVHVLRDDFHGTRHLVSYIRKGELFGQTVLQPNLHLPELLYVAAADTEIMFMTPDQVVHVCKRNCSFHQKLSTNLFRLISQQDLRKEEKIEIISRTQLRDKILTFLVLESGRQGSLTFEIPLRREELAQYLVTNRSSMIREFSRLQDEHYLQYDRRTVTLNPDKVGFFGNRG